MKLTEAIDMSNLKKPIYTVSNAISTLEGVVGLGTKTDKKLMRKALKYPILSYPKGDIDRYDSSAKISKQMLLV